MNTNKIEKPSFKMENNILIDKLYLKCLLQEWARWYCYSMDNGLGYANKSIIAKVMQYGGFHMSSNYQYQMPNTCRAEFIEELIIEMNRLDKHMALAIREYYCGRGKLREKAARIGLTEKSFSYYIKKSHDWLLQKLKEQKIKE